MKKVLKADGGCSTGSQFILDVGPTHLTDHGGSVPQLGTSEPGSYNISDVGMTCTIVTSDPMTSNASKTHSETTCSQTDYEKRLQNEFNCMHMNNKIETKESEKGTCSQIDTTTSRGCSRFALSTQHVSKFYRRHFDIVSKYNVGLKTLLLQGLSEPEFYGDLVYKFRKIIGKIDFPYHFKKIIVRYKKIGYNINVMRQTACLVVNPIKVNSFAYLFNCTTVGRTSD